jgi:uncharacterized Zn finger protein (UPF0148 family)
VTSNRCPRCGSRSVRSPDSDGDYACGLCGERWPEQSAAERDAALSAELEKLRAEIDAEPPRRAGRPRKKAEAA